MRRTADILQREALRPRGRVAQPQRLGTRKAAALTDAEVRPALLLTGSPARQPS